MKKESFDKIVNTPIMESKVDLNDGSVLAPVNMDMIWREMNICSNITYKHPDNVMIHLANKHNLEKEANITSNFKPQPDNKTFCFGMKVIWTLSIGENEVICTYNGR